MFIPNNLSTIDANNFESIWDAGNSYNDVGVEENWLENKRKCTKINFIFSEKKHEMNSNSWKGIMEPCIIYASNIKLETSQNKRS